jgi:hypothetical protein
MKLGAGLVVVGVLALAASCGKSSSSDADDDGGTSARPAGAAPGSGNGGNSAGAGLGAGTGGSTSGSGPAGGSAGSGNATSGAGAGGHAGTSATSAGTGGTTGREGGASGEGNPAGDAGAGGNPTGSLTLLVMFDRSWSMNECGDGTETPNASNQSLDCPTASRWDLTSTALMQFFQDPAAAGLNVALRFFPDDQPGCTGFPDASQTFPPPDAGTMPPAGPNCDIAVCAEPLVPAAPLLAEPAPVDVQEATLVAAVMAGAPPGPEMPNPNPQTPTFAALGGAEQWAVAYRQAHPDEPTAVVLITDGEPQGCDTDLTHIAALAADAYTVASVHTYVVGLSGSSEAGMNRIAAAGGTDKGFFVYDGSAAVQDLFDALSTIRAAKP